MTTDKADKPLMNCPCCDGMGRFRHLTGSSVLKCWNCDGTGKAHPAPMEGEVAAVLKEIAELNGRLSGMKDYWYINVIKTLYRAATSTPHVTESEILLARQMDADDLWSQLVIDASKWRAQETRKVLKLGEAATSQQPATTQKFDHADDALYLGEDK